MKKTLLANDTTKGRCFICNYEFNIRAFFNTVMAHALTFLRALFTSTDEKLHIYGETFLFHPTLNKGEK